MASPSSGLAGRGSITSLDRPAMADTCLFVVREMRRGEVRIVTGREMDTKERSY